LNERAVIPAAFIGSALGIRTLPPRSALAARDKHLQKSAVRAGGTTAARTRVVSLPDLNEVSGISGALGGFPLIVKPLSGVGAAFTTKVGNDNELREAVCTVAAGSQGPAQALVEEYISGREYHMDGYVVDGEIQFVSVSRYADNVLSVREGAVVQSVVVDPLRESLLYGRATDMASRALHALEIASSVFHLEFFVDEAGRVVFSECGARPGGGYIVQAVEAKFGIDLREVALRLAAGQPLPAAKPTAQSVGFSFLTAAPGRIVTRPQDTQILTLPGVRQVFYPYHPGDEVPDASSSSGQRLGLVLVEGSDDDELAYRLETVVQFVSERTLTHSEDHDREHQPA
jgi:biotin carboxylase